MKIYRLWMALVLIAVLATSTVRHASAAAPVAGDDGYSVKEQAVVGNVFLVVDAPGVLANDADPDTDPITPVLVPGSGPAHGKINEFNVDGSFVYEPFGGYTGTDSFQYVVNDGQTDSAPATVTITIYPNTPAVANDDSYAVDQDIVLDVPASGILANDTDTDGDALTVNGWSTPAHGDIVMNSDGSFTYTPDPGFSGQDGFGYSNFDGTSVSNIASVSITVNDVNYDPDGGNDSYNTPQDTPLQIDAPGVLTNDSDPDGDPLTTVLHIPPLHGSIDYLASDGSFRYVPDPGFTGVDTFTYELHDNPAPSAIVTVTVTVGSNGGGTDTPTPVASGTPDPHGTPDPSPTTTPTGEPSETPTATPTDDPGDGSDEGDDAEGDHDWYDSSDDSEGEDDIETSADDPVATPTAIAWKLPDTGGGSAGGGQSGATLPAFLLTIGLAGLAYGVRRRSATS
jgi:hypothetical protein